MDDESAPRFYVEEISDAVADSLLAQKKRREAYQIKKANRPPDPRPKCTTHYCRNHASTEYKGQPYCKMHRDMNMRDDQWRQSRCS